MLNCQSRRLLLCKHAQHARRPALPACMAKWRLLVMCLDLANILCLVSRNWRTPSWIWIVLGVQWPSNPSPSAPGIHRHMDALSVLSEERHASMLPALRTRKMLRQHAVFLSGNCLAMTLISLRKGFVLHLPTSILSCPKPTSLLGRLQGRKGRATGSRDEL